MVRTIILERTEMYDCMGFPLPVTAEEGYDRMGFPVCRWKCVMVDTDKHKEKTNDKIKRS